MKFNQYLLSISGVADLGLRQGARQVSLFQSSAHFVSGGKV